MDIDIIFKIAVIGIITAIINQLLVKSGKEEIATLVNISALIIVLLMVISLITELLSGVQSLFGMF